MNKKALVLAAAALSAILPSTGAFAQGRHDEKPHASTKPDPAVTERSRAGTGGRHDEGGTTHAKKKPAKKKQAAAESNTDKQ